MRKIVLTYGLISGAIISAMILLSLPLWNAGVLNHGNGAIVGYTTMVIALSVIFFGVKSYRDNYNNGAVSFGRALAIGILITLIAGVMYELSWEISMSQMSTDFINEAFEHQFTEMKANGATDAAIQEARTKNDEFLVYYRMFPIRFLITIFVELFPVGLVISLICAGLLRKKEFLPATEQI
ncbi:MAG: DUF4199 domain-containing protein [Bacteroidota bacterium]